MKMLKYVGLALAGLVVLSLLVVLGVVLLFDPNDQKARLAQLVEQRTGRSLQVPGRLELRWFPWLAVEIGEASLGNAPGFGAEPMLQIGGARLGVRLSGLLLRRRLEFDTLRLQRPVVRLAIAPDGHDNWSDVLDRLSSDAAPAASGGATPLEMHFADLRLEDGQLLLTDARDSSRIELSGLQVTTGALRTGEPFDLTSSFTLRTDPTLAITTEIAGRASVVTAGPRLRLESPRIALRLQGEGWPRDGLPIAISGGPFEFDAAAQTLALPGLKLESLGAQLEGELEGQRMIDDPRLAGRVRLAPLAAREWLARAGIDLPAMRDPKALGSLSFEGQLSATPKQLALESLTLRLDDSTARGSVGIPDLDAETLPLRFDLAVDRLDIDRYLAPGAASGKPVPAAAASVAAGAKGQRAAADRQAATEPFKLPVELLRELDLVGALRLARGQVAGMAVTDLNLGIDAQAAKLRLNPLEATLFGGRYRGDLRVDASGATPRLEFDENLAGIDLGPLLASLFDLRRFTGRGTGIVKGRAQGLDVDAWLRSAAGTVKLEVADGAIEGGDLWYEIRRARALLRREAPPARPAGTPRTAFTRLQANGRLGDGQLQSDDLAMDLQYLRVAGRGRVGLVDQSLDWTLDTRVLRIPDGDAAAAESRELVDLQVPVRVTGTLDSPSIRPDLAGLAKARVREELEKRRPELEQKKQQLEDKVRNKLQDLFKR